MGTKVQVDSYLPRYCPMRDLNHNSDGTSWASFYGESNLSNGQYYCSPLPRAAIDSSPGANKDVVKQTILKHESTFKNQVVELHRLYRVQKDLMDEITRKDQYKHGIPNEGSSSNSLLPSQMTPVIVHSRNVSIPDIIRSSGGSNLKGKSICGSPKESVASESRPPKARRMIDLELLPEEYIDVDEVEQEGNRAGCSRKPNALADLNEPVQSEATSADPSVNFFGAPRQDLPWKSNTNGTVNNFQSSSKGNGRHWLSSAPKEDSRRSVHQTNHLGKPSMPISVKSSHQPAGIFLPHLVREDSYPANANAGLRTFDRTRSFSSCSNGEAALASQPPSYRHSSDVAHSWDPSWWRPNSCLSQKSASVQASPFLSSASLSKSVQSSVWSNEFLGNGWHVSGHPRSNPGFPGESSMQNGKAAPDHKANSFDLNSTADFNLNVALPDELSSEPVADSGNRKELLDINLPCEEAEDFDDSADMKEETGRCSVLLSTIDLNSCAVEDEIPSMDASSLKSPCRVPIIDLEAPIDLETEEDDSADREAAEAIVAMSSYCADNHVEEAAGSEGALTWFVSIACSNLLSSEPDYFEEMTLSIPECTVEDYFPSPPVFDFTVEETSPANLSGRARRGPARRGRQRRDFQRDILPGLTTLARHEVTEDLQTFGGLMRATGHAWHCGTRSRNGSRRGRKKSVVVPLTLLTPPPVNKGGEIILESRSLTSWGKTRRPRRQRCPPAAPGNLAPIALT